MVSVQVDDGVAHLSALCLYFLLGARIAGTGSGARQTNVHVVAFITSPIAIITSPLRTLL